MTKLIIVIRRNQVIKSLQPECETQDRIIKFFEKELLPQNPLDSLGNAELVFCKVISIVQVKN